MDQYIQADRISQRMPLLLTLNGWYFQSSLLVVLRAQQQETVKIVQQPKEKLKRQNKHYSYNLN